MIVFGESFLDCKFKIIQLIQELCRIVQTFFEYSLSSIAEQGVDSCPEIKSTYFKGLTSHPLLICFNYYITPDSGICFVRIHFPVQIQRIKFGLFENILSA